MGCKHCTGAGSSQDPPDTKSPTKAPTSSPAPSPAKSPASKFVTVLFFGSNHQLLIPVGNLLNKCKDWTKFLSSLQLLEKEEL
jgi:hypothetical protein